MPAQARKQIPAQPFAEPHGRIAGNCIGQRLRRWQSLLGALERLLDFLECGHGVSLRGATRAGRLVCATCPKVDTRIIRLGRTYGMSAFPSPAKGDEIISARFCSRMAAMRTFCCPSLWLLLALALTSCGRSELGDEPITGPLSGTRRDAHFTGLWLVDQLPQDDLYAATYYELVADGSIKQGRNVGSGQLRTYGETGSVESPDGDSACTFGDRWGNLDERTAAIQGACLDGTPREILLRFERAPDLGVDVGAPEIASVGGEPNWVHDGRAWRFQVCAEGLTEKNCP